ncbi:MAG: NAD(P)H-hydrate dehydratase [Oscillospiraceae bacterium]|nr:NAD(P)H-hydrate dehydratase [Oscillospiraceae bacterium]
MKLATAAQMRELGARAIREAGIPSATLMTNAAAHIAALAKEVMGKNRRALIFCGPGNNGGDGIATAVALIKDGYSVRTLLVTDREKLSKDAAEMAHRLEALGGKLEPFGPEVLYLHPTGIGVIIDAIFGIGLNADVQGGAEAAIDFINKTAGGYAIPVISADIASGIEADTGRVLGHAVKATYTLTFTLPKPGNFVGQGIGYAGQVKVVDIGVPEEFVEQLITQTNLSTAADLRLPTLPRIMHKGDAGKLLMIGGSVGYTGALGLAAKAALRMGAGLVSMGVPEEIYPITAIQNLEAMPFPLPSTGGKLNLEALPLIIERLQGIDALLIGPGLGQSPDLDQLVCELIRTAPKGLRLILDADGLNAVSRHIHVLDEAHALLTLTPHDGEFTRLGGDLSHGDRLKAARQFATRHKCQLVLKGPGTITAFQNGHTFVNTTGNPGMATGGSGDVLAGMIATQGGGPDTAVWLHGRAGDLAAQALGERSMLPSDILDYIPEALKEIVR